MDLQGKQVAVLGAGSSGLAAARLAESRGASVVAYDTGDLVKMESAAARFAEHEVELRLGKAAAACGDAPDLVVISPGIDGTSDWVLQFTAGGAELVGEIEFAWRLGDAPVVAVTGTNGKTTTTDLIASVLNGAGVRTVAAGNIGLPFSEVVLSGEKYDWYTLELSSFQLETISRFRANVAVWMNFAPDHMDRYRSVQDYHSAKLRIFENQTEEDFAVVKEEEQIPGLEHQITFSAYSPHADYHFDQGWIIGHGGEKILDYRQTKLNGRHNAENVMASIAAASCVGVATKKMIPTIMDYTAPAHRCEVVAKVNGVTYVNDSKATNLHAVESSLRGQDQPVLLIAGGKEKGLDFDELTECIEAKVREVICIGETAKKIRDLWSGIVPCTMVKTLEQAVELAAKKALPRETVLFSPGTSSFDMFRNYEVRGEVFRKAVLGLT